VAWVLCLSLSAKTAAPDRQPLDVHNPNLRQAMLKTADIDDCVKEALCE